MHQLTPVSPQVLSPKAPAVQVPGRVPPVPAPSDRSTAGVGPAQMQDPTGLCAGSGPKRPSLLPFVTQNGRSPNPNFFSNEIRLGRTTASQKALPPPPLSALCRLRVLPKAQFNHPRTSDAQATSGTGESALHQVTSSISVIPPPWYSIPPRRPPPLTTQITIETPGRFSFLLRKPLSIASCCAPPGSYARWSARVTLCALKVHVKNLSLWTKTKPSAS